MILYGTNPIAWSNDDDHSLGAEITLNQCLTEAGKIDFDGIEKGHKMPTDPKELDQVLSAQGLKFISGWHSLNLLTRSVDDEKKAIQQHLNLLKAMGCKVCIVCETSNAIHGDDKSPVNQSPVLDDDQWPVFGAAVEEIAGYCAEQGITLVYHHHMGTVVETPDEIDRFMEVTGPATKLLFDTGHCYFGGGDPVRVLNKHMARTAHIHAKNVRPDIMKQVREQGLSFLEGVRRGVFTVPGDKDGAVEFEPVLKIAADRGYSGWLVIEAEQDPAVRNPFEYQSLGLQALRKAACATGLDKGK